MYAAFPRSDSYAQFDCMLGLGVSSGFPHSYSPPSLPSLAGSPVFTVEDSSRMLEVACCRMPLPRFVAPQSLQRVGQVYLCYRLHISCIYVLGPTFVRSHDDFGVIG